jgi:hypothetical protein
MKFISQESWTRVSSILLASCLLGTRQTRRPTHTDFPTAMNVQKLLTQPRPLLVPSCSNQISCGLHVKSFLTGCFSHAGFLSRREWPVPPVPSLAAGEKILVKVMKARFLQPSFGALPLESRCCSLEKDWISYPSKTLEFARI